MGELFFVLIGFGIVIFLFFSGIGVLLWLDGLGESLKNKEWK